MKALVLMLALAVVVPAGTAEAQIADDRYVGLRQPKAAKVRATRSRAAFPNLTALFAARPGPTTGRRASRTAARVAGGGCSGRAMRAAYYWQGRHTASGQPFRPDGLTAAHRSLPFGTRLTVTNPRTGASVGVVVNDRGPFTRGLDIDLSRGAARAIGMTGTGTVCVS